MLQLLALSALSAYRGKLLHNILRGDESTMMMEQAHSSRQRQSNLQIHRIPVVDGSAQLVGIVTRTDIFTALENEQGSVDVKVKL